METKVLVTADAAGNVVVKSNNNPEYGHIRVEQTRMVIDDSGFARRKKLSALIPGRVEDLAGFGWSQGDEVDGKIVIKESLTAFNKKDPERDYKIAGNTGIICKVDEQPIYRKHIYVLNSSVEDEVITHTNKEELQAAYAAAKEEGVAITPSEEFDL